jgi:hypothetical protein
MKRNLCGLVLIVAVSFGVFSFADSPATSRATAGFQKLQALAGAWEGKDDQGKTVKTSFQRIVSDTTVMETLVMHGTHEMITLYNLDGDGIALVHYCPTNNQPRMRAIPAAGDVKALEFAFRCRQYAEPCRGTRAQTGSPIPGSGPHHRTLDLAREWQGHGDDLSVHTKT